MNINRTNNSTLIRPVKIRGSLRRCRRCGGNGLRRACSACGAINRRLAFADADPENGRGGWIA